MSEYELLDPRRQLSSLTAPVEKATRFKKTQKAKHIYQISESRIKTVRILGRLIPTIFQWEYAERDARIDK